MLHCPNCGKDYSPDIKFCPVDRTPLQADATLAGDVPADPLIGQIFDDKYRLEERLGVGGMGSVYRARHILIDRPVAVKVLHQRLVEDEASRLRFHREAKASGRLQHLNAVAVTDFGQTSTGYVYIVMELLEGRTLREILAKEAPIETARAISLMLQASAAVAAAHDAGIIHRDLKPANILVTQNTDVPAIVKVLDFGIAKLAFETLDEDEPDTLTQVGVMIGTPRYMSPEQCNGFELTPASDVYSLGVILYEMLTGVSPFTGSTPLAIALKHSTDPPRPPREFVATIPEDVERIILHALEKKPEDRPPNATIFRNELLEVAEHLGLEHHALISTPDLEALRGAGHETPSGRLIVDISRLRETRVLTSGSNELTLVTNTSGVNSAKTKEERAAKAAIKPDEVRRFNIDLTPRAPTPKAPTPNAPTPKRSTRKAVSIGSAVVLVAVSGIAFLFTRSQNAVTPIAVNVNASPSPVESPTLMPSPTAEPTATPVPRRKPSPSPSPSPEEKKRGKVGSFMNKFKRILKKPF